MKMGNMQIFQDQLSNFKLESDRLFLLYLQYQSEERINNLILRNQNFIQSKKLSINKKLIESNANVENHSNRSMERIQDQVNENEAILNDPQKGSPDQPQQPNEQKSQPSNDNK